MIVQAGASEAGKQLAAETAEMVFASFLTMADGQRYYADVKGRMARLGRNPDHMKILPALLVIVGDTQAEAQEKHALLDSLVHTDSALPKPLDAAGRRRIRLRPRCEAAADAADQCRAAAGRRR